MTIPTEPIGSIPRPFRLLEAVAAAEGTDRVLGTGLASERLG